MSVLKKPMGVDRRAQIQLVAFHVLAVLAIVWQLMVVDVMVSDYLRYDLLYINYTV